MASAVPTNPFSKDDLPDQAACGAPKNTECSEQVTTEQSGRAPADRSLNRQVGHLDLINPKSKRPITRGKLLASLDDVYFRNDYFSSEEPEEPTARSPGKRAAPTCQEDTCLPCVAWELNRLPKNGDFMASVVARLEHLKACGEEASQSLQALVGEQGEELTKAASVSEELREALRRLRRELTDIRMKLSRFRQGSLLSSLEITRQQQAKRLLLVELRRLLELQRVEALLMAAVNSSVNRQLPLQAALLMEGAALFLPSKNAELSPDPADFNENTDYASFVQSGMKQMQQMLEALKADLNAILQAAARSLPPPLCACGWRSPEAPLSEGEPWRCGGLPGAAAAAATSTGEGAWPSYYSALAAFALLPPSSPVGSALSAAVAAAAAAATRQVICAFVPADAAAFSEAEAESLEAQRACAHLLLCPDSKDRVAGAAEIAAVAADAVTALPSAKDLASSVDAANGAACFMTLLGVQFDFLLGACSLMRWHAAEALRLLAWVRKERSSNLKRSMEKPFQDTDLLSLLGGNNGAAGYRRARCEATAGVLYQKGGFKGTFELAASATQRLRGLPSGLRMALFLLQVRKQFLRQRNALWQNLQQEMAEVLQELDLGIDGPSAVNDCLSLMHAVRLFVFAGEAFVSSKDTAAEGRLAAEAAAVAQEVAEADKTPASGAGPHMGGAAESEDAAAAAIAADAAAAAAAALATPVTGDTDAAAQPASSTSSRVLLSEVLLVRVQAAIESLHTTHVQQLLQQVKAETWQRLPVLRRYPLVMLRSPAPGCAQPLLLQGLGFSVVGSDCLRDSEKGSGARALCGRCGETIAACAAPNPFARWHPGQPFTGADGQAPPQEPSDAAGVELAAIEEELRAAEAWGKRCGEPPVVVAASQAAARAIMQYWQLAVAAPDVAFVAVRTMIRLLGMYASAVAAASLPEDACSCLAAPPPLPMAPAFTEGRSRSKYTADADGAVLRYRLPHLHWLLSQAGQEVTVFRRKFLKENGASSSDMGGSSHHSSGGTRAKQPLLCELLKPMARLASPGALWGLAERAAAVESAKDLLEALAQQLHLQGLPDDFEDGVAEPERQQQEHRRTLCPPSAGILCNLPREEQQQLWRLLAATRCGIGDLRALVYRLAAASLCQSNAFLASFQQAAAEVPVDRSAASAASVREGGLGGGASSFRGADGVPRAYASAVQQQRRQVADLFWRIRCAGSGSIPLNVQLFIWRCVRSQTVADAVNALSLIPLAADSVERCLNPGPLVAVAEVLREIIAEARAQYDKAAAAVASAAGSSGQALSACGDSTTADGAARPLGWTAGPGESPLDLCEDDFDCFLEVCTQTAPEGLQWCQKQRDRAFRHPGDERGRNLPLRAMSQMLQRLEDAGLLQKGQTAQFENRQSFAAAHRTHAQL